MCGEFEFQIPLNSLQNRVLPFVSDLTAAVSNDIQICSPWKNSVQLVKFGDDDHPAFGSTDWGVVLRVLFAPR
jgi:hypothetical protein